MSNADYAYSWLLNKGYSPQAAAGVVGNLEHESHVQPQGVVGDNGTAFGIAQWRGDRLTNLQRFAQGNGQDWRSLDAQLGFLDHELHTTERTAGDALRSAPDVRAATRAAISFERPQGWTAANPEGGMAWGKRFATASALLGQPVSPVNTGNTANAAGPYNPTVPTNQSNPDDSLGSALALLAPENSSNMEPLTPRQNLAQSGPFDGAEAEEPDVSVFQPRTTRRLGQKPRRA